MSEKTVILMNEADYAEKLEGHTKEKKLKVGKWDDEQQKRFIKNSYLQIKMMNQIKFMSILLLLFQA